MDKCKTIIKFTKAKTVLGCVSLHYQRRKQEKPFCGLIVLAHPGVYLALAVRVTFVFLKAEEAPWLGL